MSSAQDRSYQALFTLPFVGRLLVGMQIARIGRLAMESEPVDLRLIGEKERSVISFTSCAKIPVKTWKRRSCFPRFPERRWCKLLSPNEAAGVDRVRLLFSWGTVPIQHFRVRREQAERILTVRASPNRLFCIRYWPAA